MRTPLSLRFQLMMGVNATLGLLLTLALVADYRRELAHHLKHEKAALLAEAETISAALAAVHPIDQDSIQRLLDAVLEGMNATDTPRHRLLVRWNGKSIEPKRRTTASDDPVDLKKLLPEQSATQPARGILDGDEFVIAICTRDGIAVHVAEPLGSFRREIGFETFERLMVLVLAGLIAMAIVYFILLRAFVRPMEQLSRAVEAIGRGNLGTQTGQYRTAELSVLATSINTMSATLDRHDRERRHQMTKARKLQQHLLAPWPAIAGLTVERRFLPATEVTGDYHDAYPLTNGEWLFCIADVTGHGIPAAMTAAMLKVLFHQAAELAREPHLILQYLNSHLGSVVIPGDFATMLVVLWQPDKRCVLYANAGHEPGLLVRANGESVLLKSDGLMVGAVPEAKWSLHSTPVATDDRLFMYTDGAVEVFNSNRELFGRKALHEVVVSARGTTPKEAVAMVIQQLDDFRGHRAFDDDITLIVMDFNDPTAAAPEQNQ